MCDAFIQSDLQLNALHSFIYSIIHSWAGLGISLKDTSVILFNIGVQTRNLSIISAKLSCLHFKVFKVICILHLHLFSPMSHDYEIHGVSITLEKNNTCPSSSSNLTRLSRPALCLATSQGCYCSCCSTFRPQSLSYCVWPVANSPISLLPFICIARTEQNVDYRRNQQGQPAATHQKCWRACSAYKNVDRDHDVMPKSIPDKVYPIKVVVPDKQ